MELLNTIISIVFGSGFLFTLIEFIRYRKENKKLKEAEAKKAAASAQDADTESQEKQINLAEIFYKKMLAMTEELSNKSEVNQTKILKKMDNLDERLDRIEVQNANIEEYLNGPYHEYLAKKETKTKTKKK